MPLELVRSQPTYAVADAEPASPEPYRPDPNDPPSLTPQQIAQFAQQFYDESQPHRRLWCLCADVMDGFMGQYGSESMVRAGLEMAYFNRPRDISFNITQPQFRNASARLETEIPSWGSRAASNSVDDLAKSQAAEQMLTYHYVEDEVKYKLGKVVDWEIIFGTSAVLTAMKGDDVVQEPFGPDCIRAEPGILDPDDSRFLGVTRITTRAALNRKFPGHEAEVMQAPVPTRQDTWWGGESRLPPDRVEVLEVYCRSGHWFLLCGSAGTVLAHGKTPMKCMPVQIFRYTALPYRFFGMGMVEQAIPAQYAYSASWNQILTNARLMSQPKILIHENSGVAEDAFTSRAGEKVSWRNHKPEPWHGQSLPQYAQQLPATSQSALWDATGMHAASGGKRTPGLTTGVAIEAIVSQDEVQFGVTKRDIKRNVERMGKCALLYMQAYYPDEKIIRQFDRYGSAIAVELKATDLADNPQVFVEADTLFKDDVTARQERVMEFARMGAIPPALAIQMLQQNIDPLKPQKPISDFVEAKRALEAVIAQGFAIQDATRPPMLDGQPAMRKTVRFYPTDNFRVFADVVRQFIRSDQFYQLAPERQDDIDAFYRDILAMMAPPAEPPAQQMGKPPQKPGLPKGATPGNTPGNDGGGGPRTPERDVALQEGRAEVGAVM